MKEIKKIVIEKEEVYMRKGFDGWRVIYPIKNEDGSYNTKNLILGGNIWNFIKILIIFIILIMAIVIYHYDTKTCSNTLKNLDKVCLRFYNLSNSINGMNDIYDIDYPKLNVPLPNG